MHESPFLLERYQRRGFTVEAPEDRNFLAVENEHSMWLDVADWREAEVPEGTVAGQSEAGDGQESERQQAVSAPYPKWEQGFLRRDLSALFSALAPVTGQFVGTVPGLEWCFTGTHPDWRGRGIVTALKVCCLEEAKRRGLCRMQTENHEDNTAMLAINRRLGFRFTAPGVACIKRLCLPDAKRRGHCGTPLQEIRPSRNSTAPARHLQPQGIR